MLGVDPHRFFIFEPPFESGETVHLDLIDAGDLNLTRGIADTQVDFWFQAPTSGLVEVIIDAQSNFAVHQLNVADEFGWSWSKMEAPTS